jgi:hypothetical protein
MAVTIEANESFNKIIVADSFETSVQVIHIAIPISAFLRAGASFTQSQVIATTSHKFCKSETIFILSLGIVLAKIRDFLSFKISLNFSSDIACISSPVKILFISSGQIIHNSSAIAQAVRPKSQVITIVLIQAHFADSTAAFTSSLGGSIIQVNQTKIRFFSASLSSKIFSEESISL